MAKKKEEPIEEEKVKVLGPFTPDSISVEPVYDPALVKKYGRGRPEAQMPHTYLLTANSGRESAAIVINETNIDQLRLNLRAIFPAL